MDYIKEKNLTTISKDSINYLVNASSFAKNFLYYLTSVGHFHSSKNYITRRHDNDFNSFLLIYLIKGEMKLTIKNNSYFAHANQIILVDCYHGHHYEALCESEFLYLHFDGANTRLFVEELINNFKNVFSSEYFHEHIDIIKTIINSLESNLPLEETTTSIQLHSLLCQFTKDLTSNYKMKYSSHVQKAIQFIQNNYKNQIGIDDIASFIGLSPQHLTRIFKNEVDKTPYNFILELRLKHSLNLLRYTDYTIDEISSTIGFSSNFNYMNMFKKIYNQTPTQYRNNYTKS